MKGLSPALKKEIACRVRARREELNWPQQRLADEAHCSQQVVAQIEKEQSYSLKTLLAVSLALGIRVDLMEPASGLRPDRAGPFSPEYRKPTLHESHAAYTTMADVEHFIAKATTEDVLKISAFCIKEIGRRTRGDKA
ncbi:MAG: helix-turn-helix transcriptional regulator [Verrucomicrobiia bacterium]